MTQEESKFKAIYFVGIIKVSEFPHLFAKKASV